MPMSQLPALGALARSLDPARITNVVAPGEVGWAARQSVVFLTEEAAALFRDLRPDAVVGEPSPEPTTTTTTRPAPTTPTTTPSTTAPTTTIPLP
jgi:hypothetical protein